MDWESLSDKREMEILTRYANVGKIITWIYIGDAKCKCLISIYNNMH